MTNKRKSDVTAVDEIDRTMYSTFCSGANSLSQLYSQALNQQKSVFQAGERHALEKLNGWVLMKQQEGARITEAEISEYLQNELDYGEVSVPPRSQALQQSNPYPNVLPPGSQMQQGSFGPATGLQGSRGANLDQPNNSVFSNALLSSMRRSLPFQMAQGEQYIINGSQGRNGSQSGQSYVNAPSAIPPEYSQLHQNGDANSFCTRDLEMDMNPEDPVH